MFSEVMCKAGVPKQLGRSTSTFCTQFIKDKAELVSGPAHPTMFSVVMRKAAIPKKLGRGLPI
jgi:hypothetical protein